MAKRKSDLHTSYIHKTLHTESSQKSGVQSTDISQSIDEKSTLTGLLDGQYGEKYTNLNKLSGARTEVTYFLQVINDENNGLVNLAGFNTADPNLGSFIRIEKFTVRMEAVDMNYENTESNGAKSVESEGKIIVLPNTLLPHPNDRFTMKYLDRVRLYKITDVTPLSGDNESAYECTFMCENYDFNFIGSELRKQVVADYIFDETYVGTNLRTIYNESEYNTLLTLKDLYQKLGLLYKREFWDDQLESFILQYEDNLDVANYQSVNPAFVVIDGDKTGIGTLAESQIKKYEFKSLYRGRTMYDGLLIEFILKNRIFDAIEYFPIIPTQYATNIHTRTYTNTLFYALEKKNRRFLVNRVQLPIELNIATPDSQPILYGKLNLVHVSAPSEFTVTLYPSKLCDIIMNQVTEDIPVAEFDKSNPFDLIEYVIALFINQKNKNIARLMSVIDEKFDDLDMFYTKIPSYQAFYLFPILGYIIKCYADEIVSIKAKVNTISDPISTRRVS